MNVITNLNNTYISKKLVTFKYSTVEQFTGDYWINGKKIYQLTVNNITCTPNTSKNLLDMTNYNVDIPISIDGMVLITSDNTWWYPLSITSQSTFAGQVVAIFRRPYIRIVTGGNVTIYNGSITLKYTKTTD